MFKIIKAEPIDLELPSHRAKRGHTIFDGVVLPTLASLRKLKADKAHEDYKKLALLKNPKIKKNLNLSLLPETLKNRLIPIGLNIQDQYFEIDQASREFTITRLFISNIYGGNMQETFPVPAKKFLDIHGMNDWMFCVTEYQPEAPQLPGAPALWLDSEPGSDYPDPKRTFVKIVPINGPTKAIYQFMGMYEMKAADPPYLTVEEYCAQSNKFRDKWAEATAKMDWGEGVCARIYLRKQLGYEPSQQEIQAVCQTQAHKTTTPDEIKVAYQQGIEKMGVWTMKCVGYDNPFQRQLIERFPIWERKQAARAAKKVAGKAEEKTKEEAETKLKAEEVKVELVKSSATRKFKRKREKDEDLNTDHSPVHRKTHPRSKDISRRK